MLKVIIGTQRNQFVPQRVLEYSIRKHSSKEVDVRPTFQQGRSKGGTNFGYVRFCVPQICGYEGINIYLDADQLVLTDIHQLAQELDSSHVVGCVREIEGTFAGKPVEERNETSVMVLNCAKLRAWDPDRLFENVVKNKAKPKDGEIRYRDFMKLTWFDRDLIQAIDPRWNHYNIVRDDSKLVHFSHVREQPWKRPKHPLTSYWEEWLRETIEEGFLSRKDIFKAIAFGHIHPHFLRYARR